MSPKSYANCFAEFDDRVKACACLQQESSEYLTFVVIAKADLEVSRRLVCFAPTADVVRRAPVSPICLRWRAAYWEEISAGYLLHFPPLRRSHPHTALKRLAEMPPRMYSESWTTKLLYKLASPRSSREIPVRRDLLRLGVSTRASRRSA
jgi:hypothetical protein